MSDLNPILSGMRLEMKKMADSMALMTKTHAQYLSEEWVTKGQALAVMKISARTLEKLKSNGQLPYAKINGLIYFNTTDIEHLFKDNYVSTSTATNLDSPFNSPSNVSTSE